MNLTTKGFGPAISTTIYPPQGSTYQNLATNRIFRAKVIIFFLGGISSISVIFSPFWNCFVLFIAFLARFSDVFTFFIGFLDAFVPILPFKAPYRCYFRVNSMINILFRKKCFTWNFFHQLCDCFAFFNSNIRIL